MDLLATAEPPPECLHFKTLQISKASLDRSPEGCKYLVICRVRRDLDNDRRDLDNTRRDLDNTRRDLDNTAK